jgi:hypothetical protein
MANLEFSGDHTLFSDAPQLALGGFKVAELWALLVERYAGALFQSFIYQLRRKSLLRTRVNK